MSQDEQKAKMMERLSQSIAISQRNEKLFFNAWKRGVQLAGEEYFTCRPHVGENLQPAESVEQAISKNQLAPDSEFIKASIGALSGGQRRFLAAMCSFYNPDWGGDLLREQGVNGLADLSGNLDAEHLQILADLLISYQGW